MRNATKENTDCLRECCESNGPPVEEDGQRALPKARDA